MQVMTKRQERDIKKKKIIKISIAVTSIIVIIAGSIVMYRLFMSTKINPQINYAIGDCQYRTASTDTWKSASVGAAIDDGYEFQTGKKSEMDLLMQDGTALRITSNSYLKLNEASTGAMDFNLKRGSLYGKMKKLIRNQDINIRTSSCVAAVRGTELGVEIRRGSGVEEITGYCLKGQVDMSAEGGEPVSIIKHRKSSVLAGSPPRKAEKMTKNEIDFMQKLIDSIKTDRYLYMTSKINFESGSAEINESSSAELDKIINILEDEEGVIQIAGHTDNQGDSASNKKLSLQRAEAIKQYLIKKEFSPDRLAVTGFGDARPIYTNATDEGRSKNRRVEFVIVKD